MNIRFNGQTGVMSSQPVALVAEVKRYYHDVADIFVQRLPEGEDPLLYSVQSYQPEEDGQEGGLFFGVSTLYPGKVGHEFFMTKGHFHQQRNTAEFYWTISGSGLLLLMDEQRQCSHCVLQQHSLHYIPRRVAHRLVNIGAEPLVVGACWPSAAGHDYQSIAKKGFSKRVFSRHGQVVLEDVA